MAKPAAPSAWRQAVTSNPAATSTSPTALLVGIVIVVGALYLGSEILIPLALAILLSFMLAPIVTRLRRWHLGRIPSVLLVVLLVFTALLGVRLDRCDPGGGSGREPATLRVEPACEDP